MNAKNNTTAVVANKTTDTFELAGVAGNGAYTSGGTWVVTGLYAFDYTPETANGFVAGTTYAVVFLYVAGGTTHSPSDATRTFTVTT